MVQLLVILDNLRSAANVGSILRTADAVGLETVICCGITPYPTVDNDTRDPVVIRRNQTAIAKTALGAETTVKVEHFDDTLAAIARCRAEERTIYGLEQAPKTKNLMAFSPQMPSAIIVGNEVAGIKQDVLKACDDVLEIPQVGHKESLNVAVASGIALYRLAHPIPHQ